MHHHDLTKRFEELLRQAEQGDIEAQFQVGDCFVSGQGVQANSAKSVYWFRRAAVQGHARAYESLREMGFCERDGE